MRKKITKSVTTVELGPAADAWAARLRAELDARGEPSLNGSPSDTESREVYRRMGQAGLIGVHWPTALGGRDATVEEATELEESFGYHWLPMCELLLSVKTIGNALLRFSSSEQKASLLPAIARGELTFCQGFSEPGAGSDLAGITTTAVPADEGWRVSGRKIWTSGAKNADWIYLAARTDPAVSRHRGITVFLLPMTAPGITVTEHATIGGGQLGEVGLDDVPVPADAVVGEVDGGWSVLMATMDFERVTSEKVGVARWLLDQLTPHSTSSAHRRALLQIRGELNASRLLGIETSRALAQGQSASAIASMCKLSIALTMQKLARLAVDIVGPPALVEASDRRHAVLHGRVAAFSRAAVAATIAGGASDIQRTVIARRGLHPAVSAARR